jgi:hypothetical protein
VFAIIKKRGNYIVKKILAILLVSVIFIYIYQPAANAENIYALIDSGTGYSPDKPADEGDSLQLYDNASGISAELNRQVLDKKAFDSLRAYYNDSSLTDQELYKRLLELKNSYINALQALYNTNYMDPDKKNAETAMQIYYNDVQTLYGLNNCTVYLYNIVQYEGLANSEFVHLDMIIPDRSRNAVITIKFTIPKDKLGNFAYETIESMLSGFRFAGLPTQTKAPLVLSDKAIMGKAQLGVYPAATQKKPEYTTFVNTSAAFTVSLPATYVPFIQNSLGGVFTYTSFKINPNIIFSISSEPLQGSGMSDALMRFKVTAYGSVNVLENGSKEVGSKKYSYLSYVSSNDGEKQYYQDYYIKIGTRLFKLQLQSALAEPGSIVMEQMTKILVSFYSNGISNDQSVKSDNPSTVKYLNSDEGYSFSYPKNWRLEDNSADIAYDRLRLLIPGLSGALDISVQESELKQIVTFNDIVKSVNGKTVTSWPNLTDSYSPPFEDKTSKLLYSDFTINGPVSVIYRLSVFMDDNGRNRLCYSVDIINGRKLYSMFITSGEYKTSNGVFSDARVNELINIAASSFRLETTPESEARRMAGEIRNRKLVFVEKYLKQIIDPNLSITSVDRLQPDRTFFVTVKNSGESGFYKMKLDYQNRQVEIIDFVLKRTILKAELEKLKKLYSGKIIETAIQNESNMTLIIETRENAESERVTRTFKVSASTAGNKVEWQTVRLAHQEDYMWECENYVKSLLSNDIMVYFQSDVFTDMDAYRQNGINYPLMTYVSSSKKPGFLVLGIDPRSSIFTTKGSLIPLDSVVKNIKTEYGIKYLSSRPDAISFNPETFTLSLRTADRLGNDTLIEKYKILYNLEKGIIEYKSLN